MMHSENIVMINFAFLFQSLQNYFEMVKVNPKLRDINLEDTLSDIGCSDEIIEGMRVVRNNIFHVAHVDKIAENKQALENIF